jgi:hypothetical protein
MSGYKTGAIISGILASILAVVSVLLYENWLPASYVDNFTYLETASFAAILIVLAVGLSAGDRQ